MVALLPPHECGRLLENLDPFPLAAQQVLLEEGDPIEHVYFPTGGMCALTTIMEDGRTVEVTTVGREGLLGLSVVFGSNRSSARVICQVAGGALRVRAHHFKQHFRDSEVLRDVVMRYAETALVQTQRNAACNGLHDTESRLSKWLLMARDRLGGSDLPVTQELLATTLGVRRSSVSVAAEALHGRGLIDYHRGHIKIRDEPGLEDAACEDYRAIRDEEVRQLGPAPACFS